MTNLTPNDRVTVTNTDGSVNECELDKVIYSQTPGSPLGYYLLRIVDGFKTPAWVSEPRVIFSSPDKGGPAIDWSVVGSMSITNALVQHAPLGAFVRNGNKIAVRGSIFRDIHSVADITGHRGHSQGLLVKNMREVLIEDCVFYRCGGYMAGDTLVRSKFDQGVYIKNTCAKVTIKNCWFIECSNFGVQMRGGGTLENCVFYKCAGAISVGREDYILGGDGVLTSQPRPVTFDIRNVLILGACDIGATGQAWGIHVMNTAAGNIENVLFAHATGLKAARPLILDCTLNRALGYEGIANLRINRVRSTGRTRASYETVNGTLLNTGDIDASTNAVPVDKDLPDNLIDSLIHRPGGVYNVEHDAATYIKAAFKKAGMI